MEIDSDFIPDKNDSQYDVYCREKALGGALNLKERAGDLNPEKVIEVAEIFYRFLTGQAAKSNINGK